MYQSIIEAIKAELQLHGWAPLKGSALALKTYQTAVGPKDAHAYLQDFGANAENLVLTGEYYSEGHNCLSTTFVFIPKTSLASAVPALAARFAAEADEAVADTYAMRLAA